MMKSDKKKKKGTVLIPALIFGTIFSFLLSSVLQYALSEFRTANRSMDRDIAFHLAESGIERALYALQYNELNDISSSTWNRISSNLYTLDITQKPLGNQTGDIDISISQLKSDSFQVKSIGTVDYGIDTVSKSIQVSVDIIDVPNKTTVLRRPDFIVKEYITLNGDKNGPAFIASCDSTSYDDPVLTPASKKNTEFDVIVASLSDDSNAMTFNKTWVDGSIGTKGYEPKYDTESNADRDDNHSRLQGPDTPNGILWDNDRVIPHFNIDLPTPTKPSEDGYNVIDVNSYNWLASPIVVVGSLNKKTYIIAHGDLNFSDTHLIIQGEVVIYVDGKLISSGINSINMNGSASQATVMTKSEINLGGDLTIRGNPPQLLILGPEDASNITINTQDFRGFINAPDSDVTLNGTAPPKGFSKNDFWGGIIARNLRNIGTFELISDSSMRDQTTTTEPGVQTHIAVVKQWTEG